MVKQQSIKHVATWIINHVDRECGDSITHLKLQKLLYYSEAWFLANYDKPLFKEAPQAWVHGPVYKTIYDKYKDKSYYTLESEDKNSIKGELAIFLENVYNSYGKYSAKALEKMTHSEEPWQKGRKGLTVLEQGKQPMDKLFIRNFYAQQIKKEPIQELQY